MQSFSDRKRIPIPRPSPTRNSRSASPRAQARGRDGRGRGLAGLHHALARGLDVLRCFRHGVNALGNLDLARLTGLPKPTISRITYTLTELGYLRYHPDTGKYSPGYGVLALGYGLLAGLEVRELAKASMTELARQTGGAVALGAFDGDAMTYVEAVHGSSALYLRLPVGYRASLDSAMGRAYLASLPEDECAALAAVRPPRRCRHLPRARRLRETGCCFAIGEWQSDINAVAVPFASLTGEGVFVMSCGGPASLLSESRAARARRAIAGRCRGRAGRRRLRRARPSPRGAGPQALRPAVGISYNPRIDPPDCVPGGPLAKPSQADPQVDDRPLPQDFETALAELESLVAAMEDGSLPLEQSLAAYRRGVELTRVCQDRLAQAEQQVKVLEGDLLRPLDPAALDDE